MSKLRGGDLKRRRKKEGEERGWGGGKEGRSYQGREVKRKEREVRGKEGKGVRVWR